MSEKQKILLQLDTDSRASSFDSVVAVDSGVDVLLCHHDVTPENVVDIVYGAIFTRPAKHLQSTAIFVGGSKVDAGEAVMDKIQKTFFGNHRVSVMLDSSGANTTAAAAVVAAMRHAGEGDEPLAGKSAVVLGATGPVGRRVVRLLASAGAEVVVGSRSQDRADEVAAEISAAVEGARSITGAATGEPSELAAAMEGAELVFATGGPGVCLLSEDARKACSSLKVAIDLNAVPPEGIEGVGSTVAGDELDGVVSYGAIGVGGIKMKIHRSCVASLFEANDRVLDADEMLAVGRSF
ncbi:MAG: SDR family NAD(P)-dependent oxidoreductase [Planctomycetota bacterium]|nr:SDR family NAD(P)-dependent oxidoreductase [Planctomycetota bacterium]